MSQRATAALLIVGLTASFSAVTASGTETTAPNGAGASTTAPARLHLTAKQIVENNVKARGGLEAWRKIDTMILSGHLVTGNHAMPVVPFVQQQARPNKMRFEVDMRADKTSLRVFNGVDGWKLRPSLNGPPQLLAYTAEDMEAARDAPGIGGPLIDYQAKGVRIDFDGIDEVAGRKTYRLKVKLPSGAARRWWIDAGSFLDVKYERESRMQAGQSATVTVSFDNYKSIEGLQIPCSIITGQEIGKVTEAMVIEEVFLNRPIGDEVFSEPRAATRTRTANPLPQAH